MSARKTDNRHDTEVLFNSQKYILLRQSEKDKHYDPTYDISKIRKLIKSKNRMVAWRWEKGNGEVLNCVYKILILQDEEVLGDLMSNIVPVASNTVLYTWKPVKMVDLMLSVLSTPK